MAPAEAHTQPLSSRANAGSAAANPRPEALAGDPSDAHGGAREGAREGAPDDAHYQALVARDARFDGRLFVGVSSTGVYCRPVCRVRTPRRENCHFFSTAAQAEAARYRPCLKCRPELAPGPGPAWSVMDASRTLAQQAAAWMDSLLTERAAPAPDGAAGGLDGGPNADDAGATTGIAAVAARLGVSERHLRRIFQAEHGVTPLQYLQTRRLLLAKQLLTDTSLPVTEVALASGYGSLRRFNAVFAERYRMSPARLREGRRARPAADRSAEAAGAAQAGGDEGITVRLGFRPPFAMERLLAFFAQRAIPGIEVLGASGLRRSIRAGTLDRAGDPQPHPAGWIEVTLDPNRHQLTLHYAAALLPCSARLIAATRRWFDLDAQPALIDAALAALPGAAGMRLPGSLDGFELMVRAVLGQQVTVAGARTLARRLVDRLGPPAATPWPDLRRSFPDPAVVAGLPVATLAELGIIRSRAGAIIALAQAWPRLRDTLVAGASPEPLIDALCALPGIGPWTAHYIAMRALGWPDAWPPGDVAVLKALKLGLGGESARIAAGTLATERLAAERASAAFRPWRSYAVMRLWDAVAPAAPLEPGGSPLPASPATATDTATDTATPDPSAPFPRAP